MSLALSRTRCCSCWASSDRSVRARDAPRIGESPLVAVRYKSIMFSSAAMTACRVSTS